MSDISKYMPKGKWKQSKRIDWYLQQYAYPGWTSYFNFSIKIGLDDKYYMDRANDEITGRYVGVFLDMHISLFRIGIYIRPFKVKSEYDTK